MIDHQVTTSPDQVETSSDHVTNLTNQVSPLPAQVTTSPYQVSISPDDQQYVWCGDTSPLWVCNNALTYQHQCNYAICSLCKQNHSDSCTRKCRQWSINKDVDREQLVCNHDMDNLESISDEQYLDDLFIARKN